APQAVLDKAGVEQRRQRVAQLETHRGSALGDETHRRHPFPWRAMARSHVPGRPHWILATASLGEDFLANQKSEFDADARKADALAAHLAAGGYIMKARPLAGVTPPGALRSRPSTLAPR